MVGLGIVGPRRANHVSEDPFVDVEVLEVEGEGDPSEGAVCVGAKRLTGEEEA